MFKLRITGDLGFEFWNGVPDYEGIYQVSTYGRVMNCNGKILSLKKKKDGYLSVNLSKCGDTKTYLCHRIVGFVFIPKWSIEYSQINHKSEVKTENQVWNLEWCTPKYNSNYGTHKEKLRIASTGRIMPKEGVRKTADKHKKPVGAYLNGVLVQRFNSAQDADKENENYNYVSISAACKGRLKTYRGYVWKFLK